MDLPARRDRQRVEILLAVEERHLSQALGLAFEHFDEFGYDDRVASRLRAAVAGAGDPVLQAGLRRLLAAQG